MRAGKLVKKLRTKNGWSQQFLATEAKMSRQMVGHIEAERKRVTYESSLSLAAALGIDWQLLYTPVKKATVKR